jgi:nucleotide-binding universal stress UspA family protein
MDFTMTSQIVVPTDLSLASNSIFPHALTIAQAFGSKIYMLHVMEPDAVKKPERLEDFPHVREFLHMDIGEGFIPPLQTEIEVSKTYLYNKDPGHVILEIARRRNMDLICMASTVKAFHLAWWSAGKTMERILSRAACSVLCLRGQPVKEKDWKRPNYRHVLLLTELGGRGNDELHKVLPLVHRFNSVLHVFPLHQEKKPADQTALRELCQNDELRTNVLLFAHPENRGQNLLNFVAETPIDLIVMTPRTRKEFSNRLISDVFVRLMKATDCPILVLR